MNALHKTDCEACGILIQNGVPPKVMNFLSRKLRGEKDLGLRRAKGFSRRFTNSLKGVLKYSNIPITNTNKNVFKKCAVCIKAKRIFANRSKLVKGVTETAEDKKKRLNAMSFFRMKWKIWNPFNRYFAGLKRLKERRKKWELAAPERQKRRETIKKAKAKRKEYFEWMENEKKILTEKWYNPDIIEPAENKTNGDFNLLEHDLSDLERFEKEVDNLAKKEIKRNKKKQKNKYDDDDESADYGDSYHAKDNIK